MTIEKRAVVVTEQEKVAHEKQAEKLGQRPDPKPVGEKDGEKKKGKR